MTIPSKKVLNSATLATAMVALLLGSGCGKPERPAPAGPGVTPDKAAVSVEQVPKVTEAQRASALSPEQRKVVVAKIGDREVPYRA